MLIPIPSFSFTATYYGKEASNLSCPKWDTRSPLFSHALACLKTNLKVFVCLSAEVCTHCNLDNIFDFQSLTGSSLFTFQNDRRFFFCLHSARCFISPFLHFYQFKLLNLIPLSLSDAHLANEPLLIKVEQPLLSNCHVLIKLRNCLWNVGFGPPTSDSRMCFD